jgi:F0F1-type ATP synthase membrane subunit c/vacuolar-type H+-ATPase subunit K
MTTPISTRLAAFAAALTVTFALVLAAGHVGNLSASPEQLAQATVAQQAG